MIPAAFSYVRPSTVEEALQLLAESDGDARLLAGGHSLIPMMKLRLSRPEKLIDIGRLTELNGVSDEGDRLVIGALTTYAQLAADANVRRCLPALAEAAGLIGDLQVRNRGTIGGNLAHADPAADLPPVLLALDGVVQVAGPSGRRSVAATDFIIGPMMTALGPDEMIVEVEFPLPEGKAGSAYEKFAHPASGYAVVGVAAAVVLDDDGRITSARLGVTGAGQSAFRAEAAEAALLNQPADDDVLKAAAEKGADGVDLASDLFASAEYRGHLCRVYALRALQRAVERARASEGS